MNVDSYRIHEAAVRLGYIDARPVTGHPFDIWINRLKNIPLGQHFSFEHDPATLSGWPLNEITIWVAIASTPPVTEWPEGYGEIGAYYLGYEDQVKRRNAWETAVTEMGYEIIPDVTLPERAAAIRAGFGVHGLNGLLITPEYGSYVNITVLLVHEAPPSTARGPEYDMSAGCGSCGDCVHVCPTGAISIEDGVDTTKCLRSYMNWTEYMPEEYYPRMGRRIVGCETCQQVCPKNDFIEKITPPEDILECVLIEDLLTDTGAEKATDTIKCMLGSINKIKQQAIFAAAYSKRKDLVSLIEQITKNDDEVLAKVAIWAVKHLKDI